MYSGNIWADEMDKDRELTSSVRDRYLCDSCSTIVIESQWSLENKCCKDCFKDASGPGETIRSEIKAILQQVKTIQTINREIRGL